MKHAFLALLLALLLPGGSAAQISDVYLTTTLAGYGHPAFQDEGRRATDAQFYNPERTAYDTAGNLYFSESYLHQVFRVGPDGIVTLFAGKGEPGYNGDSGPAVEAMLDTPLGLATDGVGNLYIADSGNDCVRMVTPAGTILTIAGGNGPGDSGDGGPAASAQLDSPHDVSVANDGNIFIADTANSKIRRIDPGQTITTIAGTGQAGYTVKFPATNAQLDYPHGVLVGTNGTVYIADSWNSRVRKIDGAGIISTIAGNGTVGNAGDGGRGVDASLMFPTSLVLDPEGNLLIADYDAAVVRRLDGNGIISTFAGDGAWDPLDITPLATEASLAGPYGIALSPAGDLAIAEYDGRRVRRVKTDGSIVRLAGVGALREIGDGGPPEQALLMEPDGLDVDADGNIYIADANDCRIRKISYEDGTISTIAGNGYYGFAGNNGDALRAFLNEPYDVATDSLGNTFIAGAYSVRKIAPDGKITRVAGTDNFSDDLGDNGPATAAVLGPWLHIAVGPDDALHISDEWFDRVRRVGKDGVIRTIAGTGTEGAAGDGGPAVAAQLNNPIGITFDREGNLYIADGSNQKVRKVDTAGAITTVAGSGAWGFSGDGREATGAKLALPTDVAVDEFGNLFIANSECHCIRRVDPQGIITTIAGTGELGFSGDNEPGTSATFDWPNGLATGPGGVLYVADSGNGRVRKLEPAQIFPGGFGNAASYESGALSPGELTTVFGINIGPPEFASTELDEQGLVTKKIGETRVLVDGQESPMIVASSGQTTFVVPYSVAGKESVAIQVEYQERLTNTVTLPVVPSIPGIFSASRTGAGQAAALNQDWTYNGPANPAPRGSIVMLYLTGEGQTAPVGQDGKPNVDPYPVPELPVSVTVGGKPARLIWHGGAPYLVAGVMQLNVEIPPDVTPGDAVEVIITIGEKTSQAGITLAVE